MITTYNSEEARAKLGDILDQVATGKPIALARYNKPVGVIISQEEWRNYQLYLGAQHALRVAKLIDQGEMQTVSSDEMRRLMQEKRLAVQKANTDT